MRAIQVRCPNCNGILEVASGADSVNCLYCGTSSRIQTRSRILQVPRPLPPAELNQPKTVAQQRYGCMVVAIPLAIMAAGAIIPIVLVARHNPIKIPKVGTPGSTGSTATPPPPPPAERWQWEGSTPILADVDGDQVDDLIGFIRYVQDGDRMHLAAFSGATGQRVWQGDRLGTYTEIYQNELWRIGDLVVRATQNGAVAGHGLDGKSRWQTQLGEKVKVLCPTAEGPIAVETADEKWYRVDPASGAATEGKPLALLDRRTSKLDPVVRVYGEAPPGTCVPPDSNGHEQQPGLRFADSWSRLPEVDGMYLRRVARRGAGPIVVTGTKKPGTPVPTIAVLDGKKLRWKETMARLDPLNSRTEDHLFTIDGDAVYVIYEPPSKPPRLTAFALADGKRLWDQEVRQGTTIVMTSLFVVGPRVMLSAWGHVQSFDAATGAPGFVIGEL